MLTDPREQEQEPSGEMSSPRERRALGRELALTFVASVLLTGALALVQAHVALLAPYVYVAVAFVFVALPTLVVQRWRRMDRCDPVAAGMRFGGLGRGLAWGLGATAVTLVPFAIGFHLWSVHALERHAAPAWSNYARWDETALGRPAALSEGSTASGIWLWSENERVRLWWRDEAGVDEALAVRVEATPADATVVSVVEQGVVSHHPALAGHVVEVQALGDGGRLHGFDLSVGPQAQRLELTLTRGGARVAPQAVAIGGGQQAAASNPVVLERSLMWLINLLIVQLFFVALPEEYFYRGYLQPALARLSGERARGVLPVRAIVAASVLFALGHVLVDFAALRLTVFFPSLLFGWLRERSGGLVAPLIYHAACNVMVELAAVHYFV